MAIAILVNLPRQPLTWRINRALEDRCRDHDELVRGTTLAYLIDL